MPSPRQQELVLQAESMIAKQRDKLQQIGLEYYGGGYDAVFDRRSAYHTLQRFVQRTCKLIEEHVNRGEAQSFHQACSSVHPGHGTWAWKELCEFIDTCLYRLLQEVLEQPEEYFPTEDGPANSARPGSSGSEAVQHDVFLSYSVQDRDEARHIYVQLEHAGKKCFMAEKNLQAGDVFEDEIREAIKCASEVWILVSPHSKTSEWVMREASAAWTLEKRTVPILFQCSPGELPSILARCHAIHLHAVPEHIKRMAPI